MTTDQDASELGELGETRARVVELGEHLAALASVVAQLQAAAEQEDGPDRTGGQVKGQRRGRGGSPEGGDPPRPWCWPRMTHAEKADRLAELGDWVHDVLFAWPAAQRVIPRCWSRHWDVIEELSALYCAWRAAYLWEERTDHHACEYLDRWLPGALDRLAVRLRPCAESHQPDGARRDDAELVDRSIAELRRL